MTGPEPSLDETPLRQALDATLRELEAAGALAITGDRGPVLDALCATLLTHRAPARGAATLAAFLDRAADADAADWQRHAGTPYAAAHADEVRRQAALTHMRLEQGGITRDQAATYFASLAHALRERDRASDTMSDSASDGDR